MMSRYINVDEAIKAINKCKNPIIGNIDISDILDYNDGIQIAINELLKMPVADVEDAKHGKWMDGAYFPWKAKDMSVQGFHTATCSNCGITQSVMVYQGKIKFCFCPYCGADMRGGK